MNYPEWWGFVLLGLGVYRLWRLIGVDTITQPFRDWVTRVSEYKGEHDMGGYREKLDELITCPWCLGFWITLAVWGLWLLFPTATLVAMTPFAVSAVVGILAKLD